MDVKKIVSQSKFAQVGFVVNDIEKAKKQFVLDHLPDHRHRPIGDSWIVGQIGRFELWGRLGIIGIENRPATSVGLVDNGAAEHADGHLLVHETATLFVHANPGNEEGRDAHHMRIDYTVAVE